MIKMSKYQEALDYVNKSVCTAMACLGINDKKTREYLHTLQDLIDQSKPLTLDECIKEWEERGFEYENHKSYIIFIDKIDKISFAFLFDFKCYEIENHSEEPLVIEIDLHNLIHKTLKALEIKEC